MAKTILILIIILLFVIFSIGLVKAGCVSEHYDFHCGDIVNESCVMNENLYAEGTCFVIGASNVVIDCQNQKIVYSLVGEGYGIADFLGYPRITIKNCNIEQSSTNVRGFNLFLNNSYGSIVENNNLSKGKAGLLAMNSSGLTVKNNYGSYFEYGEAEQWDACQPFNDTAPWKYYESAIWLVDSNNATIFNNTIQGNLTEGGLTNHNGTEAGITLCRSNYSNISANIIKATDTYGIHARESHYNLFIDNFVNGSNAYGVTNTNDGIILAKSGESEINLNEFYYCNEWGIFLAGSDNNLIHGNIADYNDRIAIRIGGASSHNRVYNNSANYNGEGGLGIEGAYNIFVNNTLNSNFMGVIFTDVSLGYCHNNTLDNITLDSNNYGVYFDLNTASGCQDNLIKDSSIKNSLNYDISAVALEGPQTLNATFLNVSHNKSKVYVSNDVENGAFYVKWYLETYVNDSYGSPQEGAIVTVRDMFNNEQSLFTGQDGFIPKQIVNEYYQDAQGKHYINFYHIMAGKLGFYSVSKQLYVDGNEFVAATLKRIVYPLPKAAVD